jgi:hypothetical protein
MKKRLVDLGTEKAPGTKLAKSNFQLPTSNFLFLKTEGHVFSNPLYPIRLSLQLSVRFTGWPSRDFQAGQLGCT